MNRPIIYNTGQEPEGMEVDCERSISQYGEKVVQEIGKKIVDMLCVSYRERELVLRLICNGLEPLLCNRPNSLLEQYFHSQLDIAVERLKKEFGIDESVKVDYVYAAHAKLSSIIKAIKAGQQKKSQAKK